MKVKVLIFFSSFYTDLHVFYFLNTPWLILVRFILACVLRHSSDFSNSGIYKKLHEFLFTLHYFRLMLAAGLWFMKVIASCAAVRALPICKSEGCQASCVVPWGSIRWALAHWAKELGSNTGLDIFFILLVLRFISNVNKDSRK